ncbi:MAG: hypothetical protein ACQEW7_07510 [Pseudomonadota bacterium]
MTAIRTLSLTLLVALLAGCSTLIAEKGGQTIAMDQKFAVVPLLNLSETPQAGDKTASILAAVLRAKGVSDVRLYLPPEENLLTGDNQQRQSDAISDARADGAEIIIAGTVEEWRYKAGQDNEPAVGVTLTVSDIDNRQVLWTGTAARTGWGRDGLGTTGRKVLEDLVQAMPLSAGSN